MKRKLKNVRKVRFGLRIQLSLLLFVPILLISLLLSLAIFKQNEANILNEIIRFSGAILKGGYAPAKKYLTNERLVRTSNHSGISDYQVSQHKRWYMDGLNDLIDFFPSIVSKEQLLDQAFMININERSGSGTVEDEADTRFIYFFRERARKVQEYSKSDKVLKSLYDEFMNSVNTESRLVYASVPPEIDGEKTEKDDTAPEEVSDDIEKQKYVVVGIPVFNDKEAMDLYSEYRKFRKIIETEKPSDEKDDQSRTDEKLEFEKEFLDRLTANFSGINYRIEAEKEETKKDLYSYLTYYHYNIRRLTSHQKKFLEDEFYEKVSSKKDNFCLEDYLETAELLEKKYNMNRNRDIPDIELHFYNFLKRKNIHVHSIMSLDQLALTSYRCDLDGILGVYLLRSEFYKNQVENRREIFNMGLALFIRCVILALFLPGILIRKINLVAEGAYEIGRGNFDHHIGIRGWDEMGRLADIFNIMGKNLKRAREEILIKHRMEEELKTASEIQSILLPENLPEIPTLSFSAFYESQTEAGGDYYDIIPLDKNRFAFTVADVSGHGVGAGLVMTMTRTLIHCFAPGETVKGIMQKLNDHLYRNTASKYFVTMFYGIFDTTQNKVIFSSAGHTPPVLVRNGKAQQLEVPGVALGAVPDSMYEGLIKTKSVQLQSGDTFVLYTDGIVEAMNEQNEEYGDDRFVSIIEKNSQKSAEELKKAVLSDLRKHAGKVLQSDDITILVLKVQ